MKDEKYHDYVIKNGKFIGKFEEMYRNCADPWYQDTKKFPYKELSVELLIKLGYKKFNRILDIGCGKGKFTNFIRNKFSNVDVYGIDISETAVKIARERYPGIIFQTVDVTNQSIIYSCFDCIFMTEVIWYVIPNLVDIFSQIREGLKHSNGIFILNNHLYQDGDQKYGREHITTIETLIEKLPFNILYILENNRFNDYNVSIICKP